MTNPSSHNCARTPITLSEHQTVLLKGQRLTDAAAQKLALDLNESGRIRILQLADGLRMETSSYVGRLRLGGLDLIIQPKISPVDFVTLISYALFLSGVDLYDPSRQFYSDLGIADILVTQFADEVEHLIRRGLTQQYFRISRELTFPRGRIDIDRMARQIYLAKATLPCCFYERTSDWELNRLLVGGLVLLQRVAIDSGLHQRLKRLVNAFPFEQADLRLAAGRVRLVSENLDRLTEHYKPALEVLALVLEGNAPLLEQNEQAGIYSFLFDMNVLFQRLLWRLFREYLEELEVRHSFEKECLRYVPEFNPRNRPYLTLLPDYVIYHGKTLVSVLDAKYRDLWEKKNAPREWIYQLVAYGIAFAPVHETVILYPAVDANATEEQIELRNVLNGNREVLVRLRPVIIRKLAALLIPEARRTHENELRRFCRRLIFGEASA